MTEKKMFGGLAFLSGGYMFVGVAQDRLLNLLSNGVSVAKAVIESGHCPDRSVA